MSKPIETAIETLIENIKQDYLRYNYPQFMVEKFNEGIKVEQGRKYIKVISNGGVWGFVMKEDDKKFKAGDILMAAGYNAPARNRARGNILEGNFSWVQWTGPAYL